MVADASSKPARMSTDDRDRHHDLAESVRAASDLGRYAGLGFQFVATLALCGGLGWWLDSKLGWKPWLLVTGVMLGGGLAFAQIVLSVQRGTKSAAIDASFKPQAPLSQPKATPKPKSKP